MLFKNSVRTSKRTQHFTITKINWLMLFKKIIALYSEKHNKPINTKYGVLIIEAGGTYSYRSAINHCSVNGLFLIWCGYYSTKNAFFTSSGLVVNIPT
jgi:hypothetical protein